MSEDHIGDMFDNVIKEQVERMRLDGQSDQEIIEKLKKVNFSSILLDATKEISNDVTQYMNQTMYEKVMEYRAETKEFIARQDQKWGKCFVASEAMYIMILEATESYGRYVAELSNIKLKKDNQFTYFAMREIQGRACQEYLEILYLVKFGFADGAYARWRSMYELSIIASFICNTGEKVAKAFIEAADTEDRYDWAKCAKCFENYTKNHICFNDLQKKCDFATLDWKKQYNLANKVVHASSQGTFSRLSNKEILNIIPVGHSDYGIAISAEHSAISLGIISKLFLSIFPYTDGIIAMRCINEWIDIINQYYSKAEKEIFSDKDFKPIINNGK